VINYPGTIAWWTLEPDSGSNKPSGDINRGAEPVWMERVESSIQLTTSAKDLQVFPLSETGTRLSPLTGDDVRQVNGGYRIHLQAEGQPLSPWFELLCDGQRN
jgi:hypothetical protein